MENKLIVTIYSSYCDKHDTFCVDADLNTEEIQEIIKQHRINYCRTYYPLVEEYIATEVEFFTSINFTIKTERSS